MPIITWNMLIKLYEKDPDQRQIDKIVNLLRDSGVIIYPTDTVYGIGCDITKARAVERVARIKGIKPEKARFSFICSDLSHLSDYARNVDNHTFIRHAKPHCHSFELYKGILEDHARAVFNGRIKVHAGAQQTDAFQSNRNLLLSDEALVCSRPQLEIRADDVRCTHGATVGRLDANALFYLRSRGVGAGEARRLLTEAFAGEVLGRIGFGPLREEVTAETSARSAAAAGDGGAR